MSFRPLRDGEEEELIALWRTCDLTRPWNDPHRDIAFARGKPNSEVLVHADGSGIVAAIMVGHDGHRGAFYYLAVRPDRRGEGLGRAAVQAAEQWLAERGVWKINILVRAENASVRGFYEALGYAMNDVHSMGRRLEP